MDRLNSPPWRLSHLYWFKPKEGGLKTFRPNPFQKARYARIYPKIDARIGHREIELKSRKFGTSTGCCFLCLDNTAYRKNIEAVTMAHESKKAQEIFSNIVRPAWSEIGRRYPKLRPRERYNTRSEIDLMDSMRSKYIVSNDLKGTSPDILHISEAGYFDHDETIIESLNALPPHGIAVVESTAHGMGNWFETTFMDAWVAAQAGNPTHWLPVFNPWYADPYNRLVDITGLILRYEDEARELQEKYGLTDAQIFWWDQRKQENRDLVYQFYPSEPEEAFLHSGRPVFDVPLLRQFQDRFAHAPLRIENGISIWEDPTDAEYGIGVDTAEGKADGDNSVISVVRRDTGFEVAQIAGKIPMHQLAEKLGIVCGMYRNHLAVVERNNHGHTVIAYAKEDSRINLYQREETDKVTEKTSLSIGWDTNERSKAYAINTLARDIEDKQCIPQSHETYAELMCYVYGDRGIMGAMPGKHDDRVIALSLANIACERMVVLGSAKLADYGIY
ncbi:hypothetical protein Pan258_01950 [Symmachiella dynata]|uniref:hypothetical protein n=1 Tax=Symmachiella dynata TaxID=2527995 RepID=UPI0011885232|nr:hypothetical protein [Symmachiella dynata]QDT46178.1 hypothetical protein Pan258_01950 [Symmachiella dynata]